MTSYAQAAGSYARRQDRRHAQRVAREFRAPYAPLRLTTHSASQTFAGDDQAEDRSRVGVAFDAYLDDTSDLSTTISLSGDSATAKSLYAAQMRAEAATRPGASLNTPALVARKIAHLCDVLVLPHPVVEIARQLYKRAYHEEVFPPRTPLDGILAACIFVGCKRARVPRTLQEVAQSMGVTKKELGRRYLAMQKRFQFGVGGGKDGDADLAAGPRGLVTRYCNHLHIATSSGIATIAAEVVARAAEVCSLDGRRPTTVAAGAIYFACVLMGFGEKMKEICEVGGTTESTVQGVYRVLYAKREELVKTDKFEDGRARLDRLPPPPTQTVSG